MRNFYLLFATLLVFAPNLHAQAPKGISYQAIARNIMGNPQEGVVSSTASWSIYQDSVSTFRYVGIGNPPRNRNAEGKNRSDGSRWQIIFSDVAGFDYFRALINTCLIKGT